MSKSNLEMRAFDLHSEEKLELRIERAEGKRPVMAGYAIRFNSLSKDLGGFKERINPEAVDKTLSDGTDVRILVDHDSSKLLGRTSAGTLTIGKDERGLWFRAELPDTSYANDVQTLIDRGDIRGMSFGFRVPAGGDKVTRENGQAIRDVHNMDLREITVTSIPAYTDTSLHLRIDPTLCERIPPVEPPAPTPAPARVAAARKLKIAK